MLARAVAIGRCPKTFPFSVSVPCRSPRYAFVAVLCVLCVLCGKGVVVPPRTLLLPFSVFSVPLW